MLAWAIVHWSGAFYIDTVRARKRDSIEAFKALYGIDDATWKSDRKFKIHRAVRVSVTRTIFQEKP